MAANLRFIDDRESSSQQPSDGPRSLATHIQRADEHTAGSQPRAVLSRHGQGIGEIVEHFIENDRVKTLGGKEMFGIGLEKIASVADKVKVDLPKYSFAKIDFEFLGKYRSPIASREKIFIKNCVFRI